jgi:hypothetical protein
MNDRHGPRFLPAAKAAAARRGAGAGARGDLAARARSGRVATARCARLAAGFALSLGALTPLAAQARPADSGFFATPSGNIVCLYLDGKGVAAALLECGIKSGLRPAPPRDADCRTLDYVGNRVILNLSGRAQPVACAGDAGPFASATAPPALPYGTRWRSGGLSCSSQRTGLTCRNPAGHGFFLSRAAWRSF